MHYRPDLSQPDLERLDGWVDPILCYAHQGQGRRRLKPVGSAMPLARAATGKAAVGSGSAVVSGFGGGFALCTSVNTHPSLRRVRPWYVVSWLSGAGRGGSSMTSAEVGFVPANGGVRTTAAPRGACWVRFVTGDCARRSTRSVRRGSVGVCWVCSAVRSPCAAGCGRSRRFAACLGARRGIAAALASFPWAARRFASCWVRSAHVRRRG
jgi:hypothetical protein